MKFRNRSYKLSVTTKGGEFVTFDGTTDKHLRIKFSITHYAGGVLSQAVIDIYNLSKKSEGILSDEYAEVTLQAGYRGSIGVVFTGQSINYETRREGPDTFVRIYADSGVKYIDKIVKARSFGKSTKPSEILEILASQFGLPYIIQDVENLPPKTSGYQISSTVKVELNRMVKDHGLQWYVENGSLVIKSKKIALKRKTINVSELENGLIGYPVVTTAGIDFDTHLTHSIRLNQLVNLKTKSPIIQFSGAYTVSQRDKLSRGTHLVNKIIIEGDTHDNPWFSRFSCIQPVDNKK